MYYDNKVATLRDLFGDAELHLRPDSLTVGDRQYPIVDDVIVLLAPDEYPPALRARLATTDVARPTARPDFAEDIQFTFGAEWQAFSRVLPEAKREFERYFDLVDLGQLADARVCDLGCGTGRWSYLLRGHCRELILVDFSEAIFVARENLRGAEHALFFLGDLRRLPFRPDFADFLFCLGVLHHLPTNGLAEVRALRRHAPALLIYLYYALDNRPAYFRLLLALVTRLRLVLARVRHPRLRSLVTALITHGVYLPLVQLGRLLAPWGLGRYVPLYEGYHWQPAAVIRQSVYDRFFTRIEQRVTRQEILALHDSFRKVTISDQVPYWHFVCQR